MLSELQKSVIDQCVQEIINDSFAAYPDALIHDIADDATREKVYAKMLVNSVRLSVSLSVQLVFELLEQSEMIHVTDDEGNLRRLLLHVWQNRHESD